MATRLLSRRDVDFLLYEWLGVTSLLDRPRFAEHSRETFNAVLDLCQQIAAERFAPHYQLSDRDEPVLEDGRVRIVPEVRAALEAFAEAGLVGAAMDAEVGGLQLPATVTSACFAYFQAANISTAAYPFLSIASANMLRACGTPDQIDMFVRPLVEGRWFGTMCLSEPHAGSSLADITTRAQPQLDGSYRLTGTKMWISGGEHDLAENIVHLVLARIAGAPPGIRGISLFVVPKVLATGERNDIVLAGLNHKMGNRGTVNTVLNFGEGQQRPGGRPGAVGFLVGQPQHGLNYMFHMMNEARIGVGAAATALGYRAYLTTLDYARTRPQGRLRSAGDPHTPQVPIIEHADVRRMLLAQKSYVEGALALVLYCARLVDEARTGVPQQQADAALLLEILTPIAKSWPSQWCLAACDLAIQVHGGYGYTRDYDVEQLYRDNRLNPIHEGTQGIQGLDLLGRKVVMHDGRALRLLLDAIGRTTATATASKTPELAAWAGHLAAAAALLDATVTDVHATGDIDVTLANSSLFLDAAGHVVIAWMWLEQALVATGDAPFYAGKRHATRYFFRYELPKAEQVLQFVRGCDTTALDADPGWF